MLELYQNIRSRRKELGMSQDELAKKGYTSRSTIARIENGEIDISRSKIIAIAKALKTTPSDLMGWSDELDDEPDRKYSFKDEYLSDYFIKLSEDKELMEIISKATRDIHYKERLIQIAKILESDK